VIDCVWAAGEKVVEDGQHVARDEIRRNFHRALQELCR
jgi:hypothetical protein